MVLPVLGAASGQGEGSAHRIFQWRPFLAPFHAVVLHFPIGFLTVACILEGYRMKRPSQELRRATVLVIWLSFVTAIISATFGIMRAGTASYDAHALQLHRAFGLYVPAFMFATLVLQTVAYRKDVVRGWTYGYRFLLASTLAVVVMAGHLGGNLTHGSNYLVENAPEFVRELVAEDPLSTSDASVALNENERSYQEKVQPILAEKCYKCHGAQKQKGGYRLDQPELALKGGESGKTAIKPGDPVESHLVRLILLPPQHDDVMPPAGKEPLTSEEIMIILDWIRKGAAFPGASTQPIASKEAGTADK
jgi:uncharacterized membrane protein